MGCREARHAADDRLLRHAIANYTQTCYGYRPDPEEQITVVLGASEGMAPRSAPCSNRATAWW